jgi:predicted aminopeptidase
MFKITSRLARTVLTSLLLTTIILPDRASAGAGYYSQAVFGHIDIYSKRKPIKKLIENPDTDKRLKKKLEMVVKIRRFSIDELSLPDNGSYRGYVSLKRKYVAWNAVAAGEFSVRPKRWCFPFAGCVSYKGFFKREKAEKFGDELREEGLDVAVLPVAAYSTLGWFDDPVLNTFIGWPDQNLAGLIFHELAHAELYVKHDSAFNESFAKVVEIEGVRRWLIKHGSPEQKEAYAKYQVRRDLFVDLVLKYRRRLAELYGSGAPAEDMRREKKSILAQMLEEYVKREDEFGKMSEYRKIFFDDLNNAKLASVFTYYIYVPAFEAILRRENGDLPAFFREAKRISKLPKAKRRETLESLAK